MQSRLLGGLYSALGALSFKLEAHLCPLVHPPAPTVHPLSPCCQPRDQPAPSSLHLVARGRSGLVTGLCCFLSATHLRVPCPAALPTLERSWPSHRFSLPCEERLP